MQHLAWDFSAFGYYSFPCQYRNFFLVFSCKILHHLYVEKLQGIAQTSSLCAHFCSKIFSLRCWQVTNSFSQWMTYLLQGNTTSWASSPSLCLMTILSRNHPLPVSKWQKFIMWNHTIFSINFKKKSPDYLFLIETQIIFGQISSK